MALAAKRAAMAISNKFVNGPARLTNTMSRRRWRNRAEFTGTGRVPERRQARQRPHQRQQDRPGRVDVQDRVEREATGPLRGVVTQPVRDDPVAHLVEDPATTRQLKKMTASRSGGTVQRDFEAHTMHSRASGIASKRASAMGWPHPSHCPYPPVSSFFNRFP